MIRKAFVITLLLWLGLGLPAQAQTRNRSVGVTITWTAIGAGAGFGVGLWAGLTAFDDAINSDRKVWTSALVGAGVGALGGYLIGRSLRAPRPSVLPRAGPFSPSTPGIHLGAPARLDLD